MACGTPGWAPRGLYTKELPGANVDQLEETANTSPNCLVQGSMITPQDLLVPHRVARISFLLAFLHRRVSFPLALVSTGTSYQFQFLTAALPLKCPQSMKLPSLPLSSPWGLQHLLSSAP